jgi:N-acyl-D-amino-acid deacylase
MHRYLRIGLPLLLLGCGADVDEGPWDLLVAGATVVDGTGAPGRPGDVAVRDGRIVLVSERALPRDQAARVVEAEGLVVAPGFIDLHTHLEPLPEQPEAESHVRQGVTTAVGGPDGGGPWPLGEYLDQLEGMGLGLNVAFLIGHNTVRREVMGLDDRAPTAEELEEMRRRIARAMDEGAFGISTGLRYTPGAYSEIDEVVELSRAAAERGGIYTSHLRDEGMDLLEGVAEAIEIGRRAEIPVVLTHHKVVGAPMWGASVRTLAMVDSARAAGTDVMMDQYPYAASHTGITILLPPWSLSGGTDAFLQRLDEPALRDSIFQGIVWNIVNDRGGNDLARVQFSRVEWDRSLEGRTLRDWALREGLDPTPETGAELVIEAIRRGGANTIFHAMDEGDVERIMRHPHVAVASDGRLTRLGDGHPHPRAYGTFPRVLGHYVRERGVLSLEDAVRKMTTLPADRLGLHDRGRIREGAWADLVVFDPATVIDRATFEDPHHYPEGIPYVVVNGELVVDRGSLTDARPGRVLRRGDG